ncbi:MAG: trehalose-phosphatase [Deltaproteobacteria bacterium]|nr:trehalose-phosphatase [Deltaproteobacteria bacterium]
MKYLLGVDGVRALEAFAMANTLVAFDYDGTLAPIVENPRDAKMGQQTRILLDEIVCMAPVAIISGRARDDLRNIIDAKVDFFIGNHGLEGLPSGSASLKNANSATQKWSEVLRSDLDFNGVWVEDKVYSLAVHYRSAEDKRFVKGEILRICSQLDPAPRIVMGKFVVNLISAGSPHKGVALLELMLKVGCRSAVYFGDDDNDEDVFRLSDESLLTVRVGNNTNSAALFYIKDQGEIDRALSIMARVMRDSGKPKRQSFDCVGILDANRPN